MQWSVIHTSRDSSLSPTITSLKLSYNPFLNDRNGFHVVSNNRSHIYCLSIVRTAPSLTSGRTHSHHTQRTRPATLHGSSGQRSPVASGLHDNSLPVPLDWAGVSPSTPHTLTQSLTQALSHTETAFVPQTPVHQKRLWDCELQPKRLQPCRPNTIQCIAVETTTAAKWQEINCSMFIHQSPSSPLLSLTHTDTNTLPVASQQWKQTVRINPDLGTKCSMRAALCLHFTGFNLHSQAYLQGDLFKYGQEKVLHMHAIIMDHNKPCSNTDTDSGCSAAWAGGGWGERG